MREQDIFTKRHVVAAHNCINRNAGKRAEKFDILQVKRQRDESRLELGHLQAKLPRHSERKVCSTELRNRQPARCNYE